MTAPTSPPARAARNTVGIVAFVLALLTMLAPLVVWIVLGIAGATQANTVDDAIYVGLLGGMVVFFGTIALLSPLSVIALVLGIVSLFRPGRRGPGVFAIVVGAIGALGLFGLTLVLGEIIPGL